jgi:hypothetical protein
MRRGRLEELRLIKKGHRPKNAGRAGSRRLLPRPCARILRRTAGAGGDADVAVEGLLPGARQAGAQGWAPMTRKSGGCVVRRSRGDGDPAKKRSGENRPPQPRTHTHAPSLCARPKEAHPCALASPGTSTVPPPPTVVNTRRPAGVARAARSVVAVLEADRRNGGLLGGAGARVERGGAGLLAGAVAAARLFLEARDGNDRSSVGVCGFRCERGAGGRPKKDPARPLHRPQLRHQAGALMP